MDIQDKIDKRIGNQFWKMRDKDGRNKIFETPEALLSIINEYFEWVDNNPFEKAEQKKGNTIIPKENNLTDEQFKKITNPIINIPSKRPYEFGELCVFMGVNSKYFNDFEDGLKGKTDDISKDFSDIITYTRDKIHSSIVMGGLLGTVNPMIASRIAGLKDRQDITSNDNELPVINISFQSKPDTE